MPHTSWLGSIDVCSNLVAEAKAIQNLFHVLHHEIKRSVARESGSSWVFMLYFCDKHVLGFIFTLQHIRVKHELLLFICLNSHAHENKFISTDW